PRQRGGAQLVGFEPRQCRQVLRAGVAPCYVEIDGLAEGSRTTFRPDVGGEFPFNSFLNAFSFFFVRCFRSDFMALAADCSTNDVESVGLPVPSSFAGRFELERHASGPTMN